MEPDALTLPPPVSRRSVRRAWRWLDNLVGRPPWRGGLLLVTVAVVWYAAADSIDSPLLDHWAWPVVFVGLAVGWLSRDFRDRILHHWVLALRQNEWQLKVIAGAWVAYLSGRYLIWIVGWAERPAPWDLFDTMVKFGGFAFATFIWFNESRRKREEGMPKRLYVVFVHQKQPLLRYDDAPLSDEADIRAFAQQIGRQMGGGVDLQFSIHSTRWSHVDEGRQVKCYIVINHLTGLARPAPVKVDAYWEVPRAVSAARRDLKAIFDAGECLRWDPATETRQIAPISVDEVKQLPLPGESAHRKDCPWLEGHELGPDQTTIA